MRVAIHQPEYLGYLGFYNKMMNSDAWIMLDNVQLAKRDFVRRNRIRGQHGELMLSVPILSKGRYFQLIQDVEIDNTQDWSASHWKAIRQAYARAPYLADYEAEYAAIYAQRWEKLADLNIMLIKTTAHRLGIERPTFRASELGVTGKSSQLLADLTLAVGGDVYVSGPMGRDYLEESIFTERSLTVAYNDFTHPTYAQGPHEFMPYLAAIDLLFNCGPAALPTIIQGGLAPQKQMIS